jgi:hypothetical protein
MVNGNLVVNINDMELVQSTSLLVKCPHCGNKFSPEEAMGHDLRVQLEQEFEQKLLENSRKAGDSVSERGRTETSVAVSSGRRRPECKIKTGSGIGGDGVEGANLEQYIREQKDRTELEMKRRIFERENLIRAEAEKNAREKASIEIQEREQRLDREKNSST